MRTLVYVPIVHTPEDFGSHLEEVRESYIARYGFQQWRQHVRMIETLWHTIRQRVLALSVDFKKVRVYQDGLPLCGRERDIMEHLAGEGSKNHQLLLELVNKGAILMGTEDPALLIQERERLRKYSTTEQTGETQNSPLYDDLIEQRDAYIAHRIASTLQEEEMGLLFMGALHKVTEKLPETIRVTSLALNE